ncbi:MAG: NAD-dependent epimerase/dehydratase family protein [bacterium]|nr:NAD-dependent epimerase/dehydratase family protein [bacterium]
MSKLPGRTKKKYLITGGAGFIGSHIAEALVKHGNSVSIIDNFSTGKWENIKNLKEHITIFEEDICSISAVEKAMKGIDSVFHTAAVASVFQCNEDPVGSHKVNVSGTLNILEAARNYKVQKLVYASSAAVYGDGSSLPKCEDMQTRPVSFYAEHKLADEYLADLYYRHYGLETVGLRYFNVFGPRQTSESQYSGVISIFCNAFKHHKNPVVFGDGEQTRDFIYIKDIVKATLLAESTPGISGQIYNVGTEKPVSVNEIIKALNKLTGRNLEAVYSEAVMGDIKHSYSCINKINHSLKFTPEFEFMEGLKQLLRYYSIL